MKRRMMRLPLVGMALCLLLLAAPQAAAETLEFDPFHENWARTDKPVADGIANRTWMWGPQESAYTTYERYDESPGTERTVVYFDKARMEVSHPYRDRTDPWFVTNGLLVVELMTGQLQVGDKSFESRSAAWVNVAGDADDPDSPAYASFANLRAPYTGPEPTVLDQQVDRDGNVTSDRRLAEHGATVSHYAPDTGHWIATPFWEFMTATGVVWQNDDWEMDDIFIDPYYATGFPLTEPYWATVDLKGVPTDVLIQCFERRCLTWTPTNPAGWEVEAGNVGLHYYLWRYGELPPKPVG
jgi:hypothetical protein